MTERASTLVGRLAAIVAGGFGLVSVVTGWLVLSGRAERGYAVFGPLLWFNTLMGLAYLYAAGVIWRDARRGRRAAGAVAAINLVVLAIVGGLRVARGTVASESVAAMAFRTALWGGILAALWWVTRSSARRSPGLEQ